MRIYNKIALIFIMFTSIVGFSQKQAQRPLYISEKWKNPEWENPEIFQINREAPRATFYNFASTADAIANNFDLLSDRLR